ncbi:hypothetical protein [Kroppenstedtia guangzhouensis]|jgi:hypothetical protein|nr:hypothetical protein [Kroppenstedtia guangzhouensis]
MLPWEEVKADGLPFPAVGGIPGLWPGMAGSLAKQEKEEVRHPWPREPDI